MADSPLYPQEFFEWFREGAIRSANAVIPLINELGAFIPIFGIPVLVAWYLAFKYGAGR